MNASSATLVHDRAPQLVLVDCRKPIDARRAGAVSGTDRIEVGIRPQAIGLQARPNDTFLFHPDSYRTLCCGICGESG